MRGNDGFNEFTFRGFIELEVQALDFGPTITEGITQIEVEAGIAGKAFEVIEDNNEAFIRLGIQKT
nr:hypothetical protein [Roseibium album]